ncbi:MAG: hypothetical protein G8237_06295 [Magnetococcales bacterium]|nr:hypothetical protein [Magnetococcales bacterium]
MHPIPVILLATTLMVGCSKENPPTTTGDPLPADTARPVAARGETKKGGKGAGMIGRSRDELVQAFGQPKQILDVTLVGRPPSEGWIYPGSQCIDTYVIVEKTGLVVDYFCR